MRLHHVGIAVNSIAELAEHYYEALGIGLTTDVIVDELQKVRVAFAAVGNDVFIEFVEPLGPVSPVSGILERRGGGLYHVCYEVSDLETTIHNVCAAGGILVSGPTPARAFGGRRVAFVLTRERSLIEFLEEGG
jgi:methylmalonyl-CoA/ethylmalonyl-CoA epimerase